MSFIKLFLNVKEYLYLSSLHGLVQLPPSMRFYCRQSQLNATNYNTSERFNPRIGIYLTCLPCSNYLSQREGLSTGEITGQLP